MARKRPGQPSKYDPVFCEMLIAHMEKGLTYESFGGVVRVSKQTLYDWEKAHPEFLDAKSTGLSLALLHWDRIGVDGVHNQTIKNEDGSTVHMAVNPSVYIFNMKNRFGWRDKSPEETKEEAEASTLRELSTAQLKERLARLRNGK